MIGIFQWVATLFMRVTDQNTDNTSTCIAFTSVWSEVLMICIWSRWYATATPLSIASLKSRMVYPF